MSPDKAYAKKLDTTRQKVLQQKIFSAFEAPKHGVIIVWIENWFP